jgi:hypothetical protein
MKEVSFFIMGLGVAVIIIGLILRYGVKTENNYVKPIALAGIIVFILAYVTYLVASYLESFVAS